MITFSPLSLFYFIRRGGVEWPMRRLMKRYHGSKTKQKKERKDSFFTLFLFCLDINSRIKEEKHFSRFLFYIFLLSTFFFYFIPTKICLRRKGWMNYASFFLWGTVYARMRMREERSTTDWRRWKGRRKNIKFDAHKSFTMTFLPTSN